jgi:hypothetical protein
MSRIDDLKRKLAARQGIPGYEKNVAEIQTEIARLEALPKALLPEGEEVQSVASKPKKTKRARSAKSGEFVSKDFAAANPDTTVEEKL